MTRIKRPNVFTPFPAVNRRLKVLKTTPILTINKKGNCPFLCGVVLQMDEQTVNRTIANCLLQMLTCDNVRLDQYQQWFVQLSITAARHEWITQMDQRFFQPLRIFALKLAEFAYFRTIQPGVQLILPLNWRSLAAITRCLTVVLLSPGTTVLLKMPGGGNGISSGEIEAVEKGPREPVESSVMLYSARSGYGFPDNVRSGWGSFARATRLKIGWIGYFCSCA